MGLRNYVIRRLLLLPLTLLGISVLLFGLIHLAPGDPVRILLAGIPTANAELLETFSAKYGLDQPIHVQYGRWLIQALRGDLGYSFISHMPVTKLIGERLVKTLQLTLTAQLLAVSVALPLGVLAALRHRTWVDSLLTPLSLFGYSMPTFWIGLLAILIFSLRLGWFPSSGGGTIGEGGQALGRIWDQIRYMALPVLVLALNQLTFLFRLMRSSMLQTLREDYLRTARAKGLAERKVLFKHALRNAVLPFVTAVGLNFGYLLSGSVYVETIFGWPGLGRLTVSAALQRDYPTVMGIYMLCAVLMLVCVLLTDVAYALIDARVRYD